MKNNQIAAIDFANPTSGAKPIIINESSMGNTSVHTTTLLQGDNVSTSEISIQEFMGYLAIWFLVFAGVTIVITLFRWYFWFKKSSKLKITVWIMWILLIALAGFMYWFHTYAMKLQMQALMGI